MTEDRKLTKEFLAWAIHTYSDEGHGYLGRYFWGSPAKHMEGCVTCLFKTRRIAREYLGKLREGYNPFPKARVKRVKVIISGVIHDRR